MILENQYRIGDSVTIVEPLAGGTQSQKPPSDIVGTVTL